MKYFFSSLIAGVAGLLMSVETIFAVSSSNPFVTDRTPFPHWLPPPPGSPINNVNTFLYVLTSLIQFAEIIFWILTVGFGLYGAYLYLFAAGNSEQASRARKVFVYAAIAAVLAIVSYGIPSIVENFVFGSAGIRF